MAVYSESFNKLPGALGPDLTWTVVSGSAWEVNASNQASPGGALHGDVAYARAEHDTATADQYAEFTVVEAPSGEQGGPCARFSATANNSYMAMYQNSAITLRKTVSGVRTGLSVSTAVTVALPDVLRTEINGSTLSGWWNGVQIVSVTDTSITGNTRGGMYSDEGTGEFVVDNFEFGDLGGPAPAEATATIPLSLALGATSQATHEATTSLPLTLNVTASGETVHQATATIPLSLDVASTTSAPAVGAAEVTTEVPLTLLVSASAATAHRSQTEIPLGLGIAPVVEAPVVPGSIRAEIPFGLTLAPAVQTEYHAEAEIPLALAVEPVAVTQRSVTASIDLTLALTAVGQSEPLPADPRVMALVPVRDPARLTPVIDRRLLVPIAETLALIPILED